MADAITTKNITSVDEVQSVDNTDKVFVNDNGSFKQISVSNLMKQAPSGVTEETDPTVSEWAKQPTKPSYTADEVGALPVGTKIPTKTSDLTNDSGYLTQIPEEYVTETELGQKGYVIEDDIPEKLPSPGTLTFTGAVNDTYDGSANKTINIPTGGGEGGTSDYNALANKPKLNGVEIAGNKTSTDYKIVSSEQGIENNGKFLGVGVDGNVTPVDKPTYTADEVGARPDTWTPSAEDVGALPNNTEIPSKTSDLENDSGFITNSDIPEKLPNPQKIIFTGAVSAEYDGSTQQTINIPTGGGSDPYTLPIMSDTQLGGGKAVAKTNEDVPVAVDPETGQLFVPTYPESASADIPDGAVTKEKISQDLANELDIERHEYTEVKLDLVYANYGTWEEKTSGVSGMFMTKPFKSPQYIKIVSHTTEKGVSENIKKNAYRFLTGEDQNDLTDSSTGTSRGNLFLQFDVPDGEEQIIETYEYGRVGYEYMQLRFNPSNWNKGLDLFDVYAIYDTFRPSYSEPEPETGDYFDKDLEVHWTFQGMYSPLNTQSLIAVVPYYPNFTYNIRGGWYSTILVNSLDVLYLFDDEIFNGYHNSIGRDELGTTAQTSVPRISGYKTTQYDTTVNGGADENYKWAYHKTPPESELIGPKWVAICNMSSINEPASKDLGQEYYTEKIQEMNAEGSKHLYVSKWKDKSLPRALLTTLIRQKIQDDGSMYRSLFAKSGNPLAGAKWVLFGDSLTDAYGGHDLTGDYFASKIALEFNMSLDNRAKSGSNINTASNGNYTNVNGCAMLDDLISEVEEGNTEAPDYITVAFGTNGYKAQNGTVDDTSENKETTCGAVKYFIEKCTEKFPNAFLGFVLPPLGSWKAEDGQQFPNVNKDVDAAREAIKSVLDLPEYGGIPYIDMSKKSGITLDMLPDKIHISTDQTNLKYYRALRGFMVSAGA